LLRRCEKYGIDCDRQTLNSPDLLHGHVAAGLARHKFGVTVGDILNAIRYHTTGRRNMSVLEKIIYIADCIEPNRQNLPGLDEVRALVYNNRDLDGAVRLTAEMTLKYLAAEGVTAHPDNAGVVDS